MTKKRKLKKKTISIFIIFAFLVLAIWFSIYQWNIYQYHKTAEYKLLEKGYSKDELKLIEEKINRDYLENLVDRDKDAEFLGIIEQKYFIKENLDRYRSYIEINKKYSIEDVIALVNVNGDSEWYDVSYEANQNMNYAMLVNKVYILNENYAPDDIVNIKTQYAYEGHKIKKEVNDAFINMWNVAKENGFNFIVNSSYRTYEEQKILYDRLYDSVGRKKADLQAARPGHSEHQTGMALDIVIHGVAVKDFHNHEGYKWLLENSYKYGFILRYPQGKEHITGFEFESWHYRYVGVELATKIYQEGITFDEYYAYYLAK